MRRTKGNCGVYEIHNIKNDRRYIGCSVDIARRKKEHFDSLQCGRHQNSKLQTDWDRYGEECFVFKAKVICKKVELLQQEKDIIDSYIDVYNEDIFPPSRLGAKLSEEHKRKIGEASKGHILSAEARKKIGDANRGRVYTEEQLQRYTEINRELAEKRKGKFRHSEESKRKMSAAAKGRQHSEESKQKMSAIWKGKRTGADNPLYGKKHKEEVKKRISESRKIWWQNPDNASKMKEAFKLRWQNQEERKKQSERRKAYFQREKEGDPQWQHLETEM